ncbi:flavodoxin family protein [Methanosphaera sp. WGK6]|uniref:flavodoxin family protein n=1 Tax=Methanosphaera sp. WGK6 TaxID=1561964 RepID=UPI00084C7109|nr:flavodoxin family protein [Methanosphaera sp. WGK6]OED29733.1 flavodoxin [Methanosphaera sp. WGK6]
MRIAIRYYTKSGNTEKLANAISEVIGVEAKRVSEPLTDDVDILFLGSSVYAAGVSSDVKKFIKEINVNVGQVVNFSSAALIESTYSQVKKLVEAKKLVMSSEEFHCRGSFHMLHRNKPDESDLENIKLFAKKIINE